VKQARILGATAVVIVIVLLISVAFAGSLEPKTVQELDGLDRILSVRGLELGPMVWTDELRNESAWTIVNSANASGTISAEGSLQLVAKFAQAASVRLVESYRDVNLSLDDSPLLYLQVEVSRGINYGISFHGLFPNGTSFDTLGDMSYLQNRTGLGSLEDISANLPYEAFLATGIPPPLNSRIVRVSFYVEAGPTESGEYSMSISRLAAYGLITSSYRFTGRPVTGSFLEITLDLRQPDDIMSFYQAYMGFDLKGSADLEYTGYVTQGYSILAQSFKYRTKALTPYEFMLLSPEQEFVSGVPPNCLTTNSYSIILSAQKGSITYFHLDSLDLRYAAFNSATISVSDLPFLQGMFLLYVALIFQVPIGTVIVLYEIRKSEE
jgi:hypothetical protein